MSGPEILSARTARQREAVRDRMQLLAAGFGFPDLRAWALSGIRLNIQAGDTYMARTWARDLASACLAVAP